MTEAEFHDLVAKQIGISRERCVQLVQAFGSALESTVTGGRKLVVTKLGSFGLDPNHESVNATGAIAAILKEQVELKMDNMIRIFVEVLLNEVILDQNDLQLTKIGKFKLTSFKPYAERTKVGHRLVKKGSAIFEFFSDIKGVKFFPDPYIATLLERYSHARVVFLLPEKDFFTDLLTYYFQKSGWEPEFCTTITDANDVLKNKKPYLAIVDTRCTLYNDFVKEIKLSRSTNMIPLILLFPDEKSMYEPQSPIITGDENMVEPFEVKVLFERADDEVLRLSEEEAIFKQQVYFSLPSTDQARDKIAEYLEILLRTSGLTENKQNDLATAFREAVLNAAQHGNKFKQERRIDVQYLLDKEKASIVVKDQGEGFDYNYFLKIAQEEEAVVLARQRAQQGRLGGLGIKLMLKCVDRLEYYGTGNQLTLIKFIYDPTKKRSSARVPSFKGPG